MPPERNCSGKDHDHIGTEVLDLPANSLIGALADCDHGDECRDADEHAQHGQRGTHFVASDRLSRGREYHEPECQVRTGSELRG